jgi:hypothetical protein
MLYLKIIPLYIINFIAHNIGFVIFSFLCILSFCYAGEFEDDKYIKEVIHSGEVSGNYYYVLDDGEELQLKTESKEIPIVDKQIEYSSYSGINILLWASFITLLLGLLIYIFGESNEIDFTDPLRDTVWTLTHSEMDKDGIDYLLFDRFIRRSNDANKILHKYDIVGNIRTLSDITSLPKHYTVKKDRINKLKKLDI